MKENTCSKYHHFTTPEFAADDYFRRWVLENDEEFNRFWNTFLTVYPEKYEEVMEAKALVLILPGAFYEPPVSDGVINRIWEQIDRDTPQNTPKSFKRYWAAAAAILLVLGISFYLPFRGDFIPEQENMISTDDFQKEVQLEDGSRVLLYPHSTLRFPKTFKTGSQRIVTLSGKAFFQVSHQPERPFFVFTDNLITLVLGTSFWVDSRKSPNEVKVESGRVKVFSRENKGNGIILQANQAAVLNGTGFKRVPKIETEEEAIIRFQHRQGAMAAVFDNVPVSLALDYLEETENIDIQYNRKLFEKCMITFTFQNETLDQKLEIISKTLGVSYMRKGHTAIFENTSCD
ncbi:MAG: FecR family protein [Leadbetterella sp.]|nr:FecR family protein [Leadbetterella sp.]